MVLLKPHSECIKLVLNTTDPLLFDSKQEGDFTIAPGDIKKHN
jgi:hypothetical protein